MLHICKFIHILIVLKIENFYELYRRNGEFWKYFERETDTKNILHIIFQVHH